MGRSRIIEGAEMLKTRVRARVVLTVTIGSVVWVGASCDRGPSGGRSAELVVDTVGDTITVINREADGRSGAYALVPEVSIGRVDGEPEYVLGRVGSVATDRMGNVYVLDTQAAAIRVFAPDGSHLRSFGSRGGGPGELASPSAIAVLTDGRVVVRDPGNGRVQVFDPTGEPRSAWPILHPGYATFEPLWVDSEDRSFVVTVLPSSDMMEADRSVIVVGSEGVPLDTMPPPTAEFDPPTLEAAFQSGSEQRRAWAALPFGARATWAVHPNGSIVRGFSTRYRIEMIASDGQTLRIEKDYDPVPVEPAERDFWAARVTAAMRQTDPDWEWVGPPIPTEKPPFKEVFTGRDGRIWVSLSNPGVELENPYYEPESEGSTPVVWSETVAFDVFAPDGTYLGRADAPQNFSLSPAPVFDTGGAWAVTYDDMGMHRVVRFTLQPGGA